MGFKKWAWKPDRKSDWTRFFFLLRDAKTHRDRVGHGIVGKLVPESQRTGPKREWWVEYRKKAR
jgi:hypothetical protein